MATTHGFDSSYSGFLSLPTEVRCHIYDYILADSQAITISAGYITKFGNRIEDRARKTHIAGLPLDLAPLARPRYDASLLYVTKAPEIAVDHGWPSYTGEKAGHIAMPAPLALLLTCRLVNDEFTDYKRGRSHIKTARAPSRKHNGTQKSATENESDAAAVEGLSLYVSYPYGVLVLKSLYPYLLKQASRVYISGYHTAPQASEPGSPTSGSGSASDDSDEERLTPTNSFEATSSFGSQTSVRSFRRRRSANTLRRRFSNHTTSTQPPPPPSRPRLRLDTARPRRDDPVRNAFPIFSPVTTTLAPKILAHLIRTILPDHATPLTKFSARIIYPGENSYGTVWANKASPVSHILRNVCGGKIDMRVVRGSASTGVVFTAWPKPESRIVSTSWENWRTGHARRQDGSDLDRFLVFT